MGLLDFQSRKPKEREKQQHTERHEKQKHFASSSAWLAGVMIACTVIILRMHALLIYSYIVIYLWWGCRGSQWERLHCDQESRTIITPHHDRAGFGRLQPSRTQQREREPLRFSSCNELHSNPMPHYPTLTTSIISYNISSFVCMVHMHISWT